MGVGGQAVQTWLSRKPRGLVGSVVAEFGASWCRLSPSRVGPSRTPTPQSHGLPQRGEAGPRVAASLPVPLGPSRLLEAERRGAHCLRQTDPWQGPARSPALCCPSTVLVSSWRGTRCRWPWQRCPHAWCSPPTAVTHHLLPLALLWACGRKCCPVSPVGLSCGLRARTSGLPQKPCVPCPSGGDRSLAVMCLSGSVR